MSDHNILKVLACKYFNNPFQRDSGILALYPIRGKFPSLALSMLDNLSSPVSFDEVHSALFAMKPWKAPSPDGFYAGFFQKTPFLVNEVWNTIKIYQIIHGFH